MAAVLMGNEGKKKKKACSSHRACVRTCFDGPDERKCAGLKSKTVCRLGAGHMYSVPAAI